MADEIRADVCAHGTDERGVFCQHYETTALDASALLIPLLGFLPPDDERVRSTVLAIADELTEDELVLRYRVEETDDGFSGEEGTFTICSFWLVSALTEIGELDRARALCEKLLSYATPLFLYAEEIDPHSGRHLGNFPQAFSHLALINAVMHLIRADEQLSAEALAEPDPAMSAEASLLVVGGGPAGITAAMQGRELGAQVTLLESGQIGGTSLNRGPAPVRTLARAARLARDWSSWATFGLEGPAAGPEPPGRHGQQRTGGPLRPRQEGHSRPSAPARDRPGGGPRPGRLRRPAHAGRRRARTWSADRIIVAVGGHAGRLGIPGAELALTYEDIPSLTSLPGRVAVVGGADTGCQMASIFDDFGASVALFEAGPASSRRPTPACRPSLSAPSAPGTLTCTRRRWSRRSASTAMPSAWSTAAARPVTT